ncbi:MAG: hypothetical protein WD669_01680 [Pirellulales bacterium]
MKTIIVTVLLVLVSGGGIAWYRHDSGKALPPLRTATVERGELLFSIDATGTVEPEEVVDVGAQVAGKINSLGADPRNPSNSIDYGSPVDVGTVLAHIDDALYQSEVDQAQAQVESARAIAASTAAQVLDSQANVERTQKDLLQMQAKLYKARRDWTRADNTWKTAPGAITESDFDLAKSNYEAADAAVGRYCSQQLKAFPMILGRWEPFLHARRGSHTFVRKGAIYARVGPWKPHHLQGPERNGPCKIRRVHVNYRRFFVRRNEGRPVRKPTIQVVKDQAQ